LSGHSIHTLKFYLKIGLFKEVGRSQETRFRYFDDSTLLTLAQIRDWRKAGKSLAEILTQIGGAETSAPLAPAASTKEPEHQPHP
jgi:DNA-binding transcriptional MerR regulator